MTSDDQKIKSLACRMGEALGISLKSGQDGRPLRPINLTFVCPDLTKELLPQLRQADAVYCAVMAAHEAAPHSEIWSLAATEVIHLRHEACNLSARAMFLDAQDGIRSSISTQSLRAAMASVDALAGNSATQKSKAIPISSALIRGLGIGDKKDPMAHVWKVINATTRALMESDQQEAATGFIEALAVMQSAEDVGNAIHEATKATIKGVKSASTPATKEKLARLAYTLYCADFAAARIEPVAKTLEAYIGNFMPSVTQTAV